MRGLVAVEQMEIPQVVGCAVVEKPKDNKVLAAPGQDAMAVDFVRPLEGDEFGQNIAMEGEHEARDSTDTKVESLKPCCGIGCQIVSLYCDFPECIGCSGESQCCCLGQKGVCCKAIDAKDDPVRCCQCYKGETWCQWPKTCCYEQCQLCCFDIRGAFPCTDNVPCLGNLLCITCCADWQFKMGFCKSLGELIPRLDPNNKE